MKARNKRNSIQAAKVLATKRGTSMVRSEDETAAALRRILSTSFAGPYTRKKRKRSDLYL